MTIAERIKLLRQKRKWTQAELAEHGCANLKLTSKRGLC